MYDVSLSWGNKVNWYMPYSRWTCTLQQHATQQPRPATHGGAVVPGGCTHLPAPAVWLHKPRDSGGSSWSRPEPGSLSLAGNVGSVISTHVSSLEQWMVWTLWNCFNKQNPLSNLKRLCQLLHLYFSFNITFLHVEGLLPVNLCLVTLLSLKQCSLFERDPACGTFKW